MVCCYLQCDLWQFIHTLATLCPTLLLALLHILLSTLLCTCLSFFLYWPHPKESSYYQKKGQASELKTCPAQTYFCLEMEGQISSTKDPWLVKMKGHIKTVQVWSCQKAMCGCLLQARKVGEDWRLSSSILKLLKMSSSPSEPQHFRNTLFGCHIMKALGDYISLRHKTHFIILGIRIFWTSFISWF